jgi:glycerol-3-phosphate dehydrogenase (NAD+)
MGPGFCCGVLMGANVANDVARGQFCESTLACNFGVPANELTRRVFDCPTFSVQHILDVVGAELCGALKNVVALGAGFVDALGLGSNTKAALLRVGLREMAQFCRAIHAEMASHSELPPIQEDTFLQSCGLADLITTCYGGRNRQCAQEFARRRIAMNNTTANAQEEDTGPSRDELVALWQAIEDELLAGQKLQGTITAQDVHAWLAARHVQAAFPLMTCIYEISFTGRPIADIVQGIAGASQHRSHL